MDGVKDKFNSLWVPVTESGCWIWIGSNGWRDYGNFSYKGKTVSAHRISYQLYVGDIPDGMHICHKCDTPSCVNPDHLFAGTRSANMIDAIRKGRKPYLLNKEQAMDIKSRKHKGRGAVKIKMELAKKYGVSYSCIHDIWCGRTWTHV